MFYLDFMHNEYHRWSYMTVKQLRTRLNRITRPGKLEAFMRVAKEKRNIQLLRAANNRARQLNIRNLIIPDWILS